MRPREQKPACPECDAETGAVITRDRKAMVVKKKRQQQAEFTKPGGNRSAPTMPLPKVCLWPPTAISSSFAHSRETAESGLIMKTNALARSMPFATRARQSAAGSIFERSRYQGQQSPYDAFWGARYAVIEDPDGNAVGIMSPVDPDRRSQPDFGET